MAQNLKSGDMVKIIAGDHKGQRVVRKIFTSVSIFPISRKKGNNHG